MRVNFSFGSPSYPPIVINGQTVDIVDHVKLLGVTISNDLKFPFVRRLLSDYTPYDC